MVQCRNCGLKDHTLAKCPSIAKGYGGGQAAWDALPHLEKKQWLRAVPYRPQSQVSEKEKEGKLLTWYGSKYEPRKLIASSR